MVASLALAPADGAAGSGSSLKIIAIKNLRQPGSNVEFSIHATFPANFIVYFDYGVTKPTKRCPKNYRETDGIWHGTMGGTILSAGGESQFTGRVAGVGLPKGKYRLCGYLADNNSAAANPPLARATKTFKVTKV